MYQIINNNSLPVVSGLGTDSTGSFTITVSSGTVTFYVMLIGAGGSGGSGDQGGGGGSAGEFKLQTISLSAGVYSCSFVIGAGNGGSDWVSSNATFSGIGGTNGYGRKGNDTRVPINSVTYTAIGGSPGGRLIIVTEQPSVRTGEEPAVTITHPIQKQVQTEP